MPDLKIVSPTLRPANDWSALLPCPFCSGKAKMLSSNGSSACVVCERCGGGGPLIESDEEIEIKEHRAARAWNRRGNMAGAEDKLKKIAAVLNSVSG